MASLSHSAFEQPSFFPGHEPAPKFHGTTFEPVLDEERLTSQLDRVRELMEDGKERTLGQISMRLRKLYPTSIFPEASVSARLRDLRRTGFSVERVRVSGHNGLFSYRLVKEVAA